MTIDLARERERRERRRLAGQCANATPVGRNETSPGACPACGGEWPCMGSIVASQDSNGGYPDSQ
jgi:hypothetical protein